MKKLFFKKLNILLFRSYSQHKAASSSALYVSRDKATSVNAFITPCLEYDFDKIHQSVEARNLKININEIRNLYNFYKQVKNDKSVLEQKRQNIAGNLKFLTNSKDTNKIESLKTHGKFLREELKVIKERLIDLEADTIWKLLDLPNVLHPDTPNADRDVYSFGICKLNTKNSHLEIGENFNLIEYSNPNYYFFKNEAALLEMNILNFCAEYFSRLNYVRLSNPDFSRSIVVEGCARTVDSVLKVEDKEICNDNNFLHLVGGSTIFQFMALYTKNLIFSTLLPLRHFNSGRNYSLVVENGTTNLGLFNVAQSSNFNLFLATNNCDSEYNREFEAVLKDLREFYVKLGFHFRVVYKSAESLNKWDAFRADFEMYSTSLNKYIPYLDNKTKSYPKIIDVCVIDFPKFFGCVLEQDNYSNRSEIVSKIFNKFL